MKKPFSLKSLVWAGGMAMLSLWTSCSCPKEEAQVAKSNIIESTSIVGLWQKETEASVEDVDGNEMTFVQASTLYKCILPDGTFFIFRASTDSLKTNVSHIELYGNYVLSADTLCTETIVCHCKDPKLTGIESAIHYNMPNNNLMNVWYSLQLSDGSTGSNEWIPEVWKRVRVD